MTNHYHVLVETIDGNLSRGMRQLNGRYTQRFNRRHGLGWACASRAVQGYLGPEGNLSPRTDPLCGVTPTPYRYGQSTGELALEQLPGHDR